MPVTGNVPRMAPTQQVAIASRELRGLGSNSRSCDLKVRARLKFKTMRTATTTQRAE